MKKFLATILAAAMAFSSMAMAASPSDFTDIPDNWAKEGIEHAISNGLLNGSNGKINPDSNLTRAEMAAIVNRAVKAIKAADVSSYTDVASDKWYYSDMGKALQMGTLKGSGNSMRPEDPITREETLAVLSRVIKLSPATQSALSAFSDANQVSAWAVPEVGAMVQAGYAQGSNGKLNPKSNITRAEFAVMMDRLINQYIAEAGEITQVDGKNIMINAADVTLKGVTIEGDLYIGDGVADGDVTLDGVTITGRLVVRGGGENSVKIIGASQVGTVVAAKASGNVRIFVAAEASVSSVTVAEGSNNVTVEGAVQSVTVAAANVAVTAKAATISNAVITGENSTLVLDKDTTATSATIAESAKGAKVVADGKVDSITTAAPDSVVQVNNAVTSVTVEEGADQASVNVGKDGSVDTVTANATGATVAGEGKVTSVQANADDVKVNTPGTEVEAAAGTTGVTAGDQTVEPGKTGTVGQTTTDNSGGTTPGYDTSTVTNGVTGISVVFSDSETPVNATNSGNVWTIDASDRAPEAEVVSAQITTRASGKFETISVGSMDTNTSVSGQTLLKNLEKYGIIKDKITLSQLANAAAIFNTLGDFSDIKVTGSEAEGFTIELQGTITATRANDIEITIRLILPKA